MGICCVKNKTPPQEGAKKPPIETKQENADPSVDNNQPPRQKSLTADDPPAQLEEQDTPEDYGDEDDDPNWQPSSEEYESNDDQSLPPEDIGDLGADKEKNFHGKQIDAAEAKLAREWNATAATGAYDKLNYR